MCSGFQSFILFSLVPHTPTNLFSDKLVDVLVLGQEVAPAQLVLCPHGPNLLRGLMRNRDIKSKEWGICMWRVRGQACQCGCGRFQDLIFEIWRTYHSVAEQLKDLNQQHSGLPQREERLWDLPEDTDKNKLFTYFKLMFCRFIYYHSRSCEWQNENFIPF